MYRVNQLEKVLKTSFIRKDIPEANNIVEKQVHQYIDKVNSQAVNDEEIERDRALTTPHLLSIYDTKYPDYDFSFVVGTDLLDGLHEWDDNYPGWELTRQLIVMDRPGYEPSSKWKNASNVKFLFS